MFSSSQLLYFKALCLGLHVLLLFVYLALFGVWRTKAEQRIVVAANESNIWASHLSTIMQAVITVYTGVLLFLTQRLSLRRNLLHFQPLTVSHDVTSAWSGLGSALFSLYAQFSVTASLWGVSAVAAYLICLSLLHIVTPTLFTMELFNTTSPLTIMAIQGFPNPNLPEYGKRSVNVSNTYAVPFLAKLQANTPGLLGPIIFDVLPVSSGTGNVTVNATTFDFTCGSVQGHISEETPSDANLSIPMTNWIFRSDQTEQPLIGISNVFGPNTINTSNSIVPYISGFPGASNYANQFILTSTYNISDSQGVVESVYTLPFDVEMEEAPFPPAEGNTSFYDIGSIQVIGCTLSLLQQTAIVDVPSGNLLQVNNPVNSLSSEWTPFLLENSTSGGMEFFWTIFFGLPPIPTPDCWSPAGSDPGTDCAQVSLVDSTIMELLALPPFAAGPDIPQQITLAMLEEVLANVSALMSWVFLRSTGAEVVDVTSRQFNSSNFTSYELGVTQATLKFRLNLNVIQLGSSAFLVLILLLLAIILTSGAREDGEVDNLDFLQCLWLAHQHDDVKNLMSQIKDPSTTKLRTLGAETWIKLGTIKSRT